MKFESFKDKMGNWTELFKPFIESEKMREIYKKLKAEPKGSVTPDSSNTFRVFKECDRHKVNVIWYLQDPYPTTRGEVKVASGIAMDCSNTGYLQPSLKLFYEAMHKEVYDSLDYKFEKNPSLLPLVKQGIMFINTDLTCRLGTSASHKGYWIEFQKFFIQEILNKYYSGLIFVLSGKSSQDLEEFINPDLHHIIKTEHPVAASYAKREWNTNQVFTKIDKILTKSNNIKIEWIPEIEEFIGEVPF